MKKVFLFSIFILYGLSAFAKSPIFTKEKWLNNCNIGLAIPIFNTDFGTKIDTISYESKGKGNGLNICFDAQYIYKSTGFVIETGVGIGGLKVKDFYEGASQWGFDFLLQLGLGYAFKRDEKAIITLSGVLGYDGAFFSKDINFAYAGSTYKVTLDQSALVVFAGPKISGTTRLSKDMGLFGSCLFAIPFAGGNTTRVTYRGISTSYDSDLKSGGYFIQPAFGLSISFD